MNINYQSDFKIVEVLKKSMYDIPFEWDYSIGNKHIKVSFDGTLYDGCTKLADGQIQVVFDNHEFPCGVLHCTRTFFIADSDYEDGFKKDVYEDNLKVTLVHGSGDKETGITNYVTASVKAITPEQIEQIKSELKTKLMTDPDFIQFIKEVANTPDGDVVEETPTEQTEQTEN